MRQLSASVEFVRTFLFPASRRASSLLAVLACVGLVVAGCGGGDEEGDAGGSALSISGTPPTQVMAGQTFNFTPSVQNASGSLTFSATNLPSWATINTSTGAIVGMPDGGDVGFYSNIRVTVTDSQGSATSNAFTVEVVATATGSATLTWMPPTERTDGSALSPAALAAYRVYWGTSPTSLSNSVELDPGITTYVIDELTPATWYFAATALDTEGAESGFSNIASKSIP